MSEGFTFGSIHSSTYGIRATNRVTRVLPEVNDSYIQIPGRHGSFLFSGELADRLIEVECVISKATLANLSAEIRNIAAWLYTTDRESLSFDDEPTLYYLAKTEGQIDLEQIASVGRFTITFRCEPLAYGPEQQADFVSDQATINNPGTFEALPVFEAIFTAVAAEWKITLGAKYVRVLHDFQIGDTLEVNCATGAVLVNGVRAMDKLDWQNSEFFTLPPGENTLTITPAGVCTATTTFKPRWL
jgi:predicted phage tail component-like protein